MCTDVCTDVCTGVCIDVCTNVCTNVCIDTYTGVCIFCYWWCVCVLLVCVLMCYWRVYMWLFSLATYVTKRPIPVWDGSYIGLNRRVEETARNACIGGIALNSLL